MWTVESEQSYCSHEFLSRKWRGSWTLTQCAALLLNLNLFISVLKLFINAQSSPQIFNLFNLNHQLSINQFFGTIFHNKIVAHILKYLLISFYFLNKQKICNTFITFLIFINSTIILFKYILTYDLEVESHLELCHVDIHVILRISVFKRISNNNINLSIHNCTYINLNLVLYFFRYINFSSFCASCFPITFCQSCQLRN